MVGYIRSGYDQLTVEERSDYLENFKKKFRLKNNLLKFNVFLMYERNGHRKNQTFILIRGRENRISPKTYLTDGRTFVIIDELCQ